MASLIFNGREIPTDEQGFLTNPDDYSPELRDYMAQQMGLELTEEHLVVIETVRAYYQEFATTPPIRGLIKLLQKSGHPELGDSVKLAVLFPDGAAKTAAKLAGLPKPARCI